MSFNLPPGCLSSDIDGPDGECEGCQGTFPGEDLNEHGLCDSCAEERSKACAAELERIRKQLEALPKEELIALLWDGWVGSYEDNLEKLQAIDFSAKSTV
jgi:hypothetical protein